MIIYDCEIVNMIPGKREAPVPGIRYCAGWTDFKGMGISVIGTFDYETGRTEAFLPDTGGLHEFQALISRTDCIIGFNNHSFDDPLIRAHGIQFEDSASIDLRLECLKGLGIPMDKAKYEKGFSLPGLAFANFSMKKTEEGALAPVLWQRGERQRVIDYCVNDIHMTRRLVDAALADGCLLDPREQYCGCVSIPIAVDLKSAVARATRKEEAFKLQ